MRENIESGEVCTKKADTVCMALHFLTKPTLNNLIKETNGCMQLRDMQLFNQAE